MVILFLRVLKNIFHRLLLIQFFRDINCIINVINTYNINYKANYIKHILWNIQNSTCYFIFYKKYFFYSASNFFLGRLVRLKNDTYFFKKIQNLIGAHDFFRAHPAHKVRCINESSRKYIRESLFFDKSIWKSVFECINKGIRKSILNKA